MLEFEPSTAVRTTVHVLLYRAGELTGFVDLRLEPNVERARISLGTDSEGLRFELALVDTRPDPRERGVRLWNLDAGSRPGPGPV